MDLLTNNRIVELHNERMILFLSYYSEGIDMDIYDAIVIGAGPAGLSAAIYLARFRRKTLIIDAGAGRSSLPGEYHNIAGFLEPIARRELRKLGLEQAKSYGAEYIKDRVTEVEKQEEDKFKVITRNSSYFAKNIIFCTGIVDNWPQGEGCEKYIGYTLHSCPVCSGYETIDKKVVITGDERVTGYALELWPYTKRITSVSAISVSDINPNYMNKMNGLGIPVYEGKIIKYIGHNNQIEKVILDNGMELEAEIVYTAFGSKANSELAKKIGVAVDSKDHIAVNEIQETNIIGVYAAGDVDNFDNYQVATAMYEGYMAAYSIHKKMLKEEISNI
ncbi:MAG: pyridine nucleotide-disulfide oxidoreductase family protein [uncultured bacterium]|nr:MAG: pyridine nucleotide-disulfide oxidoreductase family protein [uncultured bacterium]